MKQHQIKIRKQGLDADAVRARRNFTHLMQRYRRNRLRHRLRYAAGFSGAVVLLLAAIYLLFQIPAEQKSIPLTKTDTANQVSVDSFAGQPLLPIDSTKEKVIITYPADSSVSLKKLQEEATNEPSRKATKGTIPAKGTPLKAQTLNDFLTTFINNPQHFTIDPTADTVLIGNQGTKVEIPAHSFEFDNGTAVEKNLTIHLQEFYTISDMVLAGLTTTSNGSLLESGGMVNISASVEDEPVHLKKEKQVTLKFPIKGEKKPMKLFTGEKTASGTVNWLLAQTDLTQEAPVFQVVEQSPAFEGGIKGFSQFIKNNLRYPEEARRQGIQGKVFIQFIIEADGRVSNIEVLKGIGGGCDEEAVRIIENSPEWTPGKMRDVPVRVRMSVPVHFILDGEPASMNENLFNQPRQSISRKPLTGNAKDTDYYYILKSNRLGWVNCDYFLVLNGQKTTLKVPLTEDKKASVVVIFKNYKSVLPANRRSGANLIFDGIPINEKILVLGLKLVKDVPMVAFHETSLTQLPAEQLELDFKPSTTKEFNTKLKKLLDTK